MTTELRNTTPGPRNMTPVKRSPGNLPEMDAAQRKAASEETQEKLRKLCLSALSPTQRALFDERLKGTPKNMRRAYLRAMAGKSRHSAIRAFCQLCIGYEPESVTLCTDPACPLYPYRPYQTGDPADLAETDEADESDAPVDDELPLVSIGQGDTARNIMPNEF